VVVEHSVLGRIALAAIAAVVPTCVAVMHLWQATELKEIAKAVLYVQMLEATLLLVGQAVAVEALATVPAKAYIAHLVAEAAVVVPE
jgi:hypothetical protein